MFITQKTTKHINSRTVKVYACGTHLWFHHSGSRGWKDRVRGIMGVEGGLNLPLYPQKKENYRPVPHHAWLFFSILGIIPRALQTKDNTLTTELHLLYFIIWKISRCILVLFVFHFIDWKYSFFDFFVLL